MATKTLTATFPSDLAAATAAGQLQRFGVGASAIALQGTRLRAIVDDAYCTLVTESLRTSGATDVSVSQNAPHGEDWMSHHGSRMTSAGVPPGQGDSEAGLA